MRSEILKLVKDKCDGKGAVPIAIALSGSRAYGTDNADSDWDFKFVFVASKSHYFGFNLCDTIEIKAPEIKSEGIGYELRKFLKLGMSANPNLLEILFTLKDDFIFLDSLFEPIIDNKQLFLSKKVYHSYGGYAKGQMDRIATLNQDVLLEYEICEAILQGCGLNPFSYSVKQSVRDLLLEDILPDSVLKSIPDIYFTSKHTVGYVMDAFQHLNKKHFNGGGALGAKRRTLIKRFGYDVKNAAHVVRLLETAISILTKHEFSVKRENVEYLKAFREGAYSLEQVRSVVQALDVCLKIARDQSILPDDADYDGIEKLAIDILSGIFTQRL